VLLCFAANTVVAQVQPSIQQSHIEGNVPDAKKFYQFLRRDISTYLKEKEPGFSDGLEIELLRDGPTQSGVSYPKYYAWVKFKVGPVLIKQGAVRVAAIDKVRFDVTAFISAAEATRDVQSVKNIFPSLLIADILDRATRP